MKKVLVTGAGGFIGSHLCEALVREGYHVRAFLHYNSNGLKGWLESSPAREEMEFVFGDIRDSDSVLSACKGCDVIFHLAALIGIPYSYISPLAYIKTNIEGTYNVLQSVLNLEIPRVLITSTSETYGTASYVPMDEKHPSVGQSPYSASKIGADQLAESYYRSFGLPVTTVRPFNTFGPRQSTRAIIPTIMTQLLKGQTSIRLGNVDPTRDFTFVKDTVAGFMAIANCDQTIGQVLNIASQKEISVGDLFEKLRLMINPEATAIVEQKRLRPGLSEVNRLLGSHENLRRLTGWSPQYSLEEGLRLTMEWFRNEDHLRLYRQESYHV